MPKENETKHDKFLRLSAQRTEGLLEKIRLIKGLSNKYYYEFTSEDVDNLFNLIKESLNEAENAFRSVLSKKAENTSSKSAQRFTEDKNDGSKGINEYMKRMTGRQ